VPIDLDAIVIGQCYLTRSGQVRRVRAATDGRVLFDNRKNPPKGERSVWHPGILDLKTFAAMVERTVPEDWTPESDKT
jgi:hypothetical protein